MLKKNNNNKKNKNLLNKFNNLSVLGLRKKTTTSSAWMMMSKLSGINPTKKDIGFFLQLGKLPLIGRMAQFTFITLMEISPSTAMENGKE